MIKWFKKQSSSAKRILGYKETIRPMVKDTIQRSKEETRVQPSPSGATNFSAAALRNSKLVFWVSCLFFLYGLFKSLTSAYAMDFLFASSFTMIAFIFLIKSSYVHWMMHSRASVSLREYAKLVKEKPRIFFP